MNTKTENVPGLLRRAKRIGVLGSLVTMLPSVAHAVAPAVVVVGVGIAFWLGLVIASKLISMQMNEMRKPILIEQVIKQDTNEVMVAGHQTKTYNKAGYSQVGVLAALPEPSKEYSKAMSIVVPADTFLEYSTNLIDWTEIHHSGSFDEETLWELVGPHGFFRLKAPTSVDDPMK